MDETESLIGRKVERPVVLHDRTVPGNARPRALPTPVRTQSKEIYSPPEQPSRLVGVLPESPGEPLCPLVWRFLRVLQVQSGKICEVLEKAYGTRRNGRKAGL